VKKAAISPPAEESSFIGEIFGSTTTQFGLAGILHCWQRCSAGAGIASARPNRAVSLGTPARACRPPQFGATGGQSVDTGTSTFNSSFTPAASQLDSNEVDPVAEADV
jgi:pilus assembly protein FimV